MITRHKLQHYLDDLLQTTLIKDYCPNGLQVEGKDKIKKIISGVTASQDLIDVAIEQQADAILVHHGYFWKGENPCVVGMKQQRLQKLLANNINLFAFHLPLDVHMQLGNNVQLAKQLNIIHKGTKEIDGVKDLLHYGELSDAISGDTFVQHLKTTLQRTPLHIAGNGANIKTLAWCTGGAQSFLQAAAALGVDAYLTGEASEQTFHEARENNIHFFAAGHHATERYGIYALGEHVAAEFQLQHEFIDLPNPI